MVKAGECQECALFLRTWRLRLCEVYWAQAIWSSNERPWKYTPGYLGTASSLCASRPHKEVTIAHTPSYWLVLWAEDATPLLPFLGFFPLLSRKVAQFHPSPIIQKDLPLPRMVSQFIFPSLIQKEWLLFFSSLCH